MITLFSKPFPTVRLLALAGVLLCLLPSGPLRAAEEIRVPFNFRWGDASQLVENTIQRAQARVTERNVVKGRKVLVVEGHPDPRLKRSLFSFESDALVEVELQYSDSAWDGPKFNAIFEQTRRNLDRKYGTSRNIARETTKVDDAIQTIIGYQWTQSYTSLRLILYTVEKGSQTFRMLSYHYRGF